MSLYWAAGGLAGGETLGVEIDRLAHERDASFVGELWAAFELKAVAAALALALSEPWGRRLPRRLLLVLGGATGPGITIYAVANFVQHALMAGSTYDAIPHRCRRVATRFNPRPQVGRRFRGHDRARAARSVRVPRHLDRRMLGRIRPVARERDAQRRASTASRNPSHRKDAAWI